MNEIIDARCLELTSIVRCGILPLLRMLNVVGIYAKTQEADDPRIDEWGEVEVW